MGDHAGVGVSHILSEKGREDVFLDSGLAND